MGTGTRSVWGRRPGGAEWVPLPPPQLQVGGGWGGGASWVYPQTDVWQFLPAKASRSSKLGHLALCETYPVLMLHRCLCLCQQYARLTWQSSLGQLVQRLLGVCQLV